VVALVLVVVVVMGNDGRIALAMPAMDTFDLDAHQPTRPDWGCRTCGDDWPCERFRDYVLATMKDPLIRSMYMGGYFQFAIVELDRTIEPGAIHTRFFAWTRLATELQPARGHPPGGVF
jgi:hypothetical protein